MANEFLAVTIEADGTLTVTDRRTGETYSRPLVFEDCADIGDGWYHGIASNDQVFSSVASPVAVALVHDGPYRATFRIRTEMTIPEEFDFQRMRRGELLAHLVVDSTISLHAGSDRLEIETKVTNPAGDHRLRVLFPTGASQATTWQTDTPFDVVERPVALHPDQHTFRELEVEARPMQGWCSLFASSRDRNPFGRGLALVSIGLHEVAAPDRPERPLALTLFRATRRTVNTEGEPDGQLKGELIFRYWLVPLALAPNRAGLGALAQLVAAGLRTAQLAPSDRRLYRIEGAPALPASASLLQVDGPVVVTSIREVDGALEVRLFNPERVAVSVAFDFSGRPLSLLHPHSSQRVDFESRPLEDRQPIGERFTVQLEPKKIVTIRLV